MYIYINVFVNECKCFLVPTVERNMRKREKRKKKNQKIVHRRRRVSYMQVQNRIKSNRWCLCVGTNVGNNNKKKKK